MKKVAFALLMIATVLHAEDSPLVKAAKASGGPKKKSTKKVITNADVKKSGGKLTVLPGAKPGATAAATAEPAKSAVTKHEDQQKAADAASKRVIAAQTKVSGLEKELASIEQTY